MTRLALESHGDLEPCDLELKRQGKSYTVDTLEILHEMYPEDRIFCIVGADMLLGIDMVQRPGASQAGRAYSGRQAGFRRRGSYERKGKGTRGRLWCEYTFPG